MDVPLFPAPPSRGNITTPVSDVSDVATVTRIPASIVWRVRGRHAVAEPARERSSCVKKRCRIRRRSVHPRAVFNEDAARRRITEFRVRMTERRAKHDERDDDDDVVCGDVGRCKCKTTVLKLSSETSNLQNRWYFDITEVIAENVCKEGTMLSYELNIKRINHIGSFFHRISYNKTMLLCSKRSLLR